MTANVLNRLLLLPRWAKRALMIAIDVAICVASVIVAYYLRLGFWPAPTSAMLLTLAVAPLFAVPIFYGFDLYQTLFRHVGISVLWTMSRAVLIYGLMFAALFTGWSVPGVPRTVGLIQPGLLLLFAIATRTLLARLVTDRQTNEDRQKRGRMLIYGAGSAGRQLAAALSRTHEVNVIGFVDDDLKLRGHLLEGLRIYGSHDLKRVIAQKEISDILLAIPSASRRRRQEVLAMVRRHGVGVRVLPPMHELASGKIVASDLRDVDIVDLLGRPTVDPDALLLSRDIAGKTVLISGAGGSIGSELCRQVAAIGPRRLILVENSEYALYNIHAELTGMVQSPETALVQVLASVCNESRMTSVFEHWRPDTVYHAAAYKHVPLVESNPVEGIFNNVEGTRVMARCALKSGVANFVLISTDKAVRPTNVMGASKRIAELVLQAMVGSLGNTRFSMVRFGNVLGSSGSVVPLFRRQIASGGPVTLTDARVTRYFMTIPEAAELVIQAGAMAVGGEVFVLDMGAPVRIADLAREMIELSGLSVRDEINPGGDIEIVITGLRPGEKLYEELLIGENDSLTSHPRIKHAHEPFFSPSVLDTHLANLHIALETGDASIIRAELTKIVSGYMPSGYTLANDCELINADCERTAESLERIR